MRPLDGYTQEPAFEVIRATYTGGPMFYDRVSAEMYQKRLHEAGMVGSIIVTIPLWKAPDEN